MAAEIDMSNGRANVASAYGQPPMWHRLGQTVMPDASLEEWQEAGGLNWSAIVADLMFEDLFGEKQKSRYVRSIFRSDTQAELGFVSTRYQVVQPREVLEFFRTLTGQFGGFQMDVVGSLFGGRKIWALARTREDLEIASDDIVRRHLLVTTSFDRSLQTTVCHTATRVVCANTLAVALSGNSPRIEVPHTTKFDQDLIKRQMLLDKDWAEFARVSKALARRAVTNEEALGFFGDVLYPESKRRGDFSFIKAEREIGQLMATYENGHGQDLSSVRGTAWGLVNAVTLKVDHLSRARTDDARLDRAWYGQGADLKEAALTLAAGML